MSYKRAEPTQFLVLIPTSLKSILILSSHLRLGLPKGLFPVGLPVKVLKELSSSILATWSAHFNLLDLFTLTIFIHRDLMVSSQTRDPYTNQVVVLYLYGKVSVVFLFYIPTVAEIQEGIIVQVVK